MMQRTRISHTKPIGIIIAVLCVGAALVFGIHVSHEDSTHPSSDSASIDAEVVHIASTVGGRLKDLHVSVNQHVHKGEVLYQLDPEPYELIVRQAQANLDLANAEVENQTRLLSIKTSNAATAEDQVVRARTNRDLAARTVERLKPLAGQSYIPWQQYDQARVALHDAEVSLSQSQNQSTAATTAIGNLKSSLAARDASQAALDHARYELRQTVVSAPTDGYVTSLRVKEGEVLAPSQVLFTLISDDEWYATANIREINLSSVQIDDCVTVYSMIDRHIPLRGHIESIGWGVLSVDSAGIARSLPVVPRQMDWVHVAQRFPVRIRLEKTNPHLLRLGATATVEIRHGAACP